MPKRRQGGRSEPSILLTLIDDDTEEVVLDSQLYVDTLTPSFVDEDLPAYFKDRIPFSVNDWFVELGARVPRLVVFVQSLQT